MDKALRISDTALCYAPEQRAWMAIPSASKEFVMLMFRERRLAYRTIEGWARSVLLEVGAIRECEEHGWMQDRTDPHAHHRAIEIAREMPPPGVSPEAAAIAVAEVLDGIGDTCPECCRKRGTDDGLFGSDSA